MLMMPRTIYTHISCHDVQQFLRMQRLGRLPGYHLTVPARIGSKLYQIRFSRGLTLVPEAVVTIVSQRFGGSMDGDRTYLTLNRRRLDVWFTRRRTTSRRILFTRRMAIRRIKIVLFRFVLPSSSISTAPLGHQAIFHINPSACSLASTRSTTP